MHTRPATGLIPTLAAPGRPLLFWGMILLLALASLWLRQAIPLDVRGAAGIDDALFASQARILAQGYWLGSYDNMTHAKGMAYPAFIAANFHLGLPLKMSEHLLYLGGAALMAAVMVPLVGRRWALVAFALLAFQPASWAPDLARVLRENFFMALTILLLAVAVRLYLVEEAADGPSRRRLGWSVLLGLLVAAYWLTREEAAWIFPSLGLLVLYWLAGIWRVWQYDGAAPTGPLLRRLVLPLAVCLLALGAVNGINWILYGVFRSVDMRSHDFVAAYSALSRVKTGEDNSHFLFTSAIRPQVFAVSPAARELQPLFDGEAGRQALTISCNDGPVDEPRRCSEIVSGWLQWILRDFVRRLGYYRRAADADAYYRRLAEEINAACEAGTLSCLPPRHTMAPPFYAANGWKAVSRFGEAVAVLTRFGGAEWRPVPPPSGPPEAIRLFRDITHGPLPPWTSPGKGLFLSGWVRTAGSPDVLLRHRDDAGAPAGRTELETWPEPGRAGPGQQAAGFHVTSTCSPADCVLVVRRSGADPLVLPLEPLPAAGPLVETSDTLVMLEASGPAEAGLGLSLQTRIRAVKERILRALTFGFAWTMPVLAAAAGLLFAAGLVAELRRRTLSAASLLGMAVLGGLAARLLLLTFIDVTTFPALSVYYMAPAYPLLCLFVVLGLMQAGRLRTAPP